MQRPFEFVSHTKILHNSNRTSILFRFFLQLPLSGKGNAGVRTLHYARSVKCTLRFHHIAKSQPCAFRSGYTVLWHTSPEEQRRAHVHHHTDDLKSRNTSKKISVLQQALPVAHSLQFIHNLWSVLGSKHPQLGVQTLTAKQDQPDS